MKIKLLIPLFAFCLLSCSLFAQPKTFNVGVDFIPNYSFYSGDESGYYISQESDYSKKMSLKFGVVLTYQLDNRWSFESGLKYVNRGHEGGLADYWSEYIFAPITIPYTEGTLVTNYNYLSVPLNVRLSLNNNCNKGWYLRFGVSSDFYLFSKSVYTRIGYDGEKRVEESEISEDIRKTHLNLNYGVGYSFLLGDEYQISIEPAFEYMFYRLYHKGRNFTYNSVGIKMRLMIL